MVRYASSEKNVRRMFVTLELFNVAISINDRCSIFVRPQKRRDRRLNKAYVIEPIPRGALVCFRTRFAIHSTSC